MNNKAELFYFAGKEYATVVLRIIFLKFMCLVTPQSHVEYVN